MSSEILIILIVLFSLNAFVGILHFLVRPKSKSNFYFGFFVVLFSLSILHIFNINAFFRTPYNSIVLLPFNLIFLPLYFILRYLDNLLSFQVFSDKFEKAVFIIALIELSSNLLPTGAWVYTNQFDNDMIAFVFKIKRVFIFLLLPFGIYTILRVRKCVKSYNTSLTDDKNKVNWIKEMLIGLSILLILIVLPDLARLILIKPVYLFVIQAIIGSLIIIYLGIRNLNIQINTAIISAEVVNPYNPETNNNFKLILNFVQSESMYLNPELRITDLAEKISLSPNYVSKIINENAGMNFNDFVNEYRVNEVIGKFRNKEHLKKSIYALAQESGFKSKSTFQTAFRKSTGKTPTEYLKWSEIQ